MLRRAQRSFDERCRELAAWPVSDWQQSLDQARISETPLVMAGFGAMGPKLASRLRELGASTWPPEAAGDARIDAPVVSCVDGADELRRAARWCREQLQRDPGARLLVVDLMLERRRALAQQCFEHELVGDALGRDPLESPFAIEGGQELASHATVSTALRLLRLACGELEFPELGALLRSPYLGLGGSAPRAALELLLRRLNVVRADCALLGGLARTARFDGSVELAAGLATLAAHASEMALGRDRPSHWAPRFAAVLAAGGWPGDLPLASPEQQQCQRFTELLGEFSSLEAGGDRLVAGAAVELLDALATRTAFDAATGDVPVTVTASTDDPLVGYDGIWVAGLGSETWPLPPRADPFVPLAAQHAVGFPPASPAGRLDEARHAMSCWQRCARELVYSWPASDGEVPVQASGLLKASPATEPADGQPPPAIADALVAGIRACENREPRPLERARAWPAGQPLVGGTRILELQSECPFRAAAELRLGATELPEPIPGLDHRERGLLLHRALELAWRQLGSSRELRARAGAAGSLEELARECSERSLRERLAKRATPLAPALAENEARRLAVLLSASLQQDLARPPSPEYRVTSLEEPLVVELGGHAMRIRMDRIDELEDGRRFVIDYKSGAAKPFYPLDERPRQAQLLAYAAAAGEGVAGVAALHLTADATAWRGAIADPALLPALRGRAPTEEWPLLLARWRRVVATLVGDFAGGQADVDPLPHACDSCPLPGLCRIDADRVLSLAADDEPAGTPAEEASRD